MADEVQIEGSEPPPPAVDPQIEAEARRTGWRPKDQYQGRPEEWVDAPTYVRRGREIHAHLKGNNERLAQENAALRAQQAAAANEINELKGQVTGLVEFRDTMATREHERSLAQLAQDLKQARADGDVDREVQILAKIGNARPPRQAATGNGDGRSSPQLETQPPATQPARVPPEIPQEMRDWTAANPWFGQDPIITQAMNTIGAQMRAEGKFTEMTLTESLNATAKVVQERYMPAPNRGAPRVEGNGRPPDGGPRTPAEGTWESLPAHIKAECDAQGKRLGLIGEKKTFKNLEEWRKHYVAQYTRMDPNSGYDFRPPGN